MYRTGLPGRCYVSTTLCSGTSRHRSLAAAEVWFQPKSFWDVSNGLARAVLTRRFTGTCLFLLRRIERCVVVIQCDSIQGHFVVVLLAQRIGRACLASVERRRCSSSSCNSAGAMYGTGLLGLCGASDGLSSAGATYWTGLLGQCGASGGVIGWHCVLDGLARTVRGVDGAAHRVVTRLARR
jgi:hypothetical protein